MSESRGEGLKYEISLAVRGSSDWRWRSQELHIEEFSFLVEVRKG